MKRDSVRKNKKRLKEFASVTCNISQENLENYIEEHGSSLDALFKMGYWYRKNGYYDEALFYLKPLLGTRFNKHVLLELAKIYLIKKQYMESYGCMMLLKGLNPEIMDDGGYDSFIYYLARQLNIDLDVKIDSLRYRNVMIYKYDKDMALCHIKSHLNPAITGKPPIKGEVYFNKDIKRIIKLLREV